MPSRTYYFDLARAVASGSKDLSTQCGFVIVGHAGEVVSTGYNGFPRMVGGDNPDDIAMGRQARPEKYLYTEHAERNAIYQAAHSGASVAGCKGFLWTSRPVGICSDCARGVIQSGITYLFLYHDMDDLDSQWEHTNAVAQQMLAEANVRVTTGLRAR